MRFVVEDPIGLAGGLNVYEYGNSSATNDTDPQGTINPFLIAVGAAYARCVTRCEAFNALADAVGGCLCDFKDDNCFQSCANPLNWLPIGKMAKIAQKGGNVANNAGDIGQARKQARLRELAKDTLRSADRGWIKQEMNSIERGERSSSRNPPGKELTDERGPEAAKDYDYRHSNLQDRDLHRLQQKYDDFGRANTEPPLP